MGPKTRQNFAQQNLKLGLFFSSKNILGSPHSFLVLVCVIKWQIETIWHYSVFACSADFCFLYMPNIQLLLYNMWTLQTKFGNLTRIRGTAWVPNWITYYT